MRSGRLGSRVVLAGADIARIRANAGGFHDPETFITMIMLDRVLGAIFSEHMRGCRRQVG